ncbi:MAG: 50S ribosomal protein L11 methyltransferase [Myxococcales bacterium]|nr:50S ribosomal protein L11 methyltransferase [Myxococcales bacterium]
MMLAEDPRVAGVELRDDTTLEFATAEPELVVYVDPDNIAAVIAALHDVGAQLGLTLEATAERHADDSWRDGWRRFYAPRIFGERIAGRPALLLRPSWIERRPGDPARELVLDPGRAFGTGLHESTQLCLELLIDHLDRAAPARLLDLGCGSGILALAASALVDQPLTLVAVDNDPEAVAVTLENAALSRRAAALDARVGDVSALASDPPFDLILANIRPEVLIPAAPDVCARLAPTGALILGGILDEEGDDVAAAYRACGLTVRARPSLGGWCGLLLEAT